MRIHRIGPCNIESCKGWLKTKCGMCRCMNNVYFIYTTGILWLEEDITKNAFYRRDGHAVQVMCDKIKKVWNMVPL